MSASKATRDRRIAEGKCTVCENPAAPLVSNPKKLSKFCASHLKYFQHYKKVWNVENPSDKPKTIRKCVVCRQTGHNLTNCTDPRAAQFRQSIKLN